MAYRSGVSRLVALTAAALVALAVPAAAATRPASYPPTQPNGGSSGPTIPADRLRAANVVPPGESGLDTLVNFAGTTAGVTQNGPHVDDQLGLYAGWQYKSMQLTGPTAGAAVPGDTDVTISRDAYGVPTITAGSDPDAFYGVGYAMAQDRLFQMEVFRHVGAGTLASLVGSSGLPMDIAVRRVTEGAAARAAEFAALPAAAQQRITSFVAGINAEIQQTQFDPSTMPAEFTLLGDQPIRNWTVDDVLSFGEYAGRFFGQFTGANLTAAATYLDLVQRYGQAKAEQVYDDEFALQDPDAPTSVAAADGTFPRHTGTPVAHAFAGSAYANHDPALLPPLAQVAPVASASSASISAVRSAQRLLGLPKWGSNAVVVAGSRTADGKPMLYGGPQTGWAVPGFFWEAEIHDPVRSQRGVMVPDVPLFVIGRTADTSWTVTSALDANADVFVDTLDATNTTYVHDGTTLTVAKQTETIACNNPPTTATGLLGGQVPPLCPVPPTTLTVYRTVHGPALADPDAGHHLYTLQSSVDGRLLSSLDAWDEAGRQHTASAFGAALARMSLGFNFFYVDDHGDIGYWHTGAYPIRPRNADPSLPLPGDGSFDWQGFEAWSAHPHVVDPSTGYVVNWNNKPAVGWWSPAVVGELTQPDRWGEAWESQPLAADVPARTPLTFATLGQLPHDVAYVDNRARVLLPTLLSALQGTTDPQLAQALTYLRAWDGQRDHVNDGSYGPAITFFDRFFEHLQATVEQPVLGDEYGEVAGLSCTSQPCHYVSTDNEDTETYKYEGAPAQTLLAALQGHTAYDWFGAVGGVDAAFVTAARAAAAELDASTSSDPADWTEPAESTTFSAQGAISVASITPLQNRGSYGQVVEAVGAPGRPVSPVGTTAPGGSGGSGGTGGTLATTGLSAGVPLVATFLVAAGVALRRRRSG